MNIYLQFPENEIDKHKEIFSTFCEIVKICHEKKFKIHYSSSNIASFLQNNEEFDIYLTGEANIVRHLLSPNYNKTELINFKNSGTYYYLVNFNDSNISYMNNILSQLSEKIYSNKNYDYILVNLDISEDKYKNQLITFRECEHLPYPDFFTKINFVKNKIDFLEWLKTLTYSFSLRDESKFRKCSGNIVKGATVYNEISNNRYWHLDTLHDYVEYEIYDSQGNHIGTADENGIFKRNPVSGRKITI